MALSPDLVERCRKVRLLVLDCDGVLTDGSLYFTERGEETKVFNVRDGYGIVQWHRAGFRSAIISGRSSTIVDARAKDLGIEFVWQGREDKVAALDELMSMAQVTVDEVAYVGDDILDVPVMKEVGFGATVADAHHSACVAAHYIARCSGGRGAVREIIDMLLDAKK